jgi:hypothetical protein
MYNSSLIPMFVAQRFASSPFRCLNFCMFARLYRRSVKFCCFSNGFILPANAKGIPNPVAVRAQSQQIDVHLVVIELLPMKPQYRTAKNLV